MSVYFAGAIYFEAADSTKGRTKHYESFLIESEDASDAFNPAKQHLRDTGTFGTKYSIVKFYKVE